MSTAHTPGPWATRPIYGSLPDQAHALFWQDGQRSRRLDDGGVFKAGDAALIAAAPDLLAEAEANARFLEQIAAHLEVNDMPGQAGNCTIRAKATRAAIAKAEGRS